MSKKIVSRVRATKFATDHDTKVILALEVNQRLLSKIQDKIEKSPALNGGFETLMFKVNNIENAQTQLVETVASINEAVFKPDDGLFARVKEVERISDNVENVNKIEKDVLEIKLWKNNEEKVLAKGVVETEENEKLAASHSIQLIELQKWKQRINSVTKWTMVTIATGITTLFGKLIYDFIVGHIKFV